MADCTNCGAMLSATQTHCHTCGAATPYRKTQRSCMNCGSPAAQDAKTCMMCGHTIDDLPRTVSSFSVSWPGVLVGLAIIVSLAYWFFQIQPTSIADTAEPTATFTPFFIPPTATVTPTPSQTPTPTQTPTVTQTPTPTPIIHRLAAGETLLIVADLYNVTIDDIVANNDVSRETILRVGQELVIPYFGNVPSPSGGDLRNRPTTVYRIESGDTLSGISVQFDVSMADIRLANPDINLDLLSVGQEITIPLPMPTATPTPTITPTPTFTAQPPYPAPRLLNPPEGILIEGDEATILFQWSSSGLLDEEEYYVIYLTDETNTLQTYWTQNTSYRLSERPPRLTEFTWYVVVMKRLAEDAAGLFYGDPLSNPSESRSFRWR